MTAIPRRLLPDSAAVGADGQLLDRRLRHRSTWPPSSARPLFVYDEAHLRARCREAVAAFGPGVSYATKAFLCRAMARLAARGGHAPRRRHRRRAPRGPGRRRARRPAGAARQQQVARRAAHRAWPTASVASWSTRSTSSTASRRCVAERPARSRRCSCASRRASRPTPTSSCAPARTTRSSASAWRSGAAAAALARAAASPAVELVGLHAHIGSQVFEAEFFEHGRRGAGRRSSPSTALPELSIGGGLGVAYVEGEEAPTITEWADAVHRAVRRGRHRRPASPPSRGGPSSRRPRSRSTRSGTIKDLPGIRTYVAGRRRHERQPAAGALRQRLRDLPAPGRRRRPRPRRCRVVGKHCESGDLLVREGVGARRTSRSATSSARRSPAPTATRWAPTTTRCPARRWCSWPTAGARLVVRRETARRPPAPRRRLSPTARPGPGRSGS